MNIISRIEEQSQLAVTYLEDGAPHSAARVLSNLAAEVKQHAEDSDRLVAAFLGERVPDADPSVDVYSPWGSGPVPIERREG